MKINWYSFKKDAKKINKDKNKKNIKELILFKKFELYKS